MNKIDLAFAFYIIFFCFAFFISYKYGSYMTRKTGLIFPQFFIAGTINFAMGAFALIGWFFYTWRVNEFLFFGGLFFGVCLLVVGEGVLIFVLLLKRKKLVQIYNDSLKNTH